VARSQAGHAAYVQIGGTREVGAFHISHECGIAGILLAGVTLPYSCHATVVRGAIKGKVSKVAMGVVWGIGDTVGQLAHYPAIADLP